MTRLKIILGLVGIILLSSGLLLKLRLENLRLKATEERTYGNYMAEKSRYDSLLNQSNQYKMSLEEIENDRDSLTMALLTASDELKVKRRDIRRLQRIESSYSHSDTITIRDTVFQPSFRIDTVLSNEWRRLRLNLSYPNTAIVDLAVYSKKNVVVHTRRFIRKPSKWFFIRWFQKRSTETIVTIKDENPYIEEADNKFIEVVE